MLPTGYLWTSCWEYLSIMRCMTGFRVWGRPVGLTFPQDTFVSSSYHFCAWLPWLAHILFSMILRKAVHLAHCLHTCTYAHIQQGAFRADSLFLVNIEVIEFIMKRFYLLCVCTCVCWCVCACTYAGLKLITCLPWLFLDRVSHWICLWLLG